MEIFWDTIKAYNSSTWFLQLIIVGTGIFLTIGLYWNPTKKMNNAMKIFMVFLNLWISVFYYLIYGSEREYYFIFAIFWGIIASVWLYDLVKGNYHFERSYKYDKIAYLLYAMPFVYPMVSLWRGLHFPMMTSPVMPCTVAIFSLGLLMSFSKRINLFLILFLFHWTILGISKIYLYKLPEDIILAICSVPPIFLYFKEYINSVVYAGSKPGVKTINALLISSGGIIGIIFSYVIFKSFGIL
jgi:hypothetical protein